MFGYVNVYKDLLRVCDYNTFRGYYCGLCKQLGKDFNQLTRFGLSYDMTFLSILISSLNEESLEVKKQSCIAHPLTKRNVIFNDKGIEYSAEISIILTYLKLKDDWYDEKSLKSLAGIFYYFPNKKAIKKHNKKYKKIAEYMKKLQLLEKQNCQSVDEVADCFGKILEVVFDRDNSNKALAWLGYHIGRFIYITDAYNDIDKDIKNNSYNPFVAMLGNEIDKGELKQNVKASLELTLSEISNAYNLLNIKKNKELLNNIIYLGLRQNIDKF